MFVSNPKLVAGRARVTEGLTSDRLSQKDQLELEARDGFLQSRRSRFEKFVASVGRLFVLLQPRYSRFEELDASVGRLFGARNRRLVEAGTLLVRLVDLRQWCLVKASALSIRLPVRLLVLLLVRLLVLLLVLVLVLVLMRLLVLVLVLLL